jgi:hypothetical protein
MKLWTRPSYLLNCRHLERDMEEELRTHRQMAEETRTHRSRGVIIGHDDSLAEGF